MIEEWKLYKITGDKWHKTIKWEVSNFGRVKKNGELYQPNQNNRYYAFSDIFLHRAVAKLFIGDIPIGMQIDHIDGDKHNNRVDNLRICTCKENNNNPITCKRRSISRTGKSNGPFSDEARKHISEGHKGKPSPRKGMQSPYKGKHRIYNDDGTYHYK